MKWLEVRTSSASAPELMRSSCSGSGRRRARAGGAPVATARTASTTSRSVASCMGVPSSKRRSALAARLRAPSAPCASPPVATSAPPSARRPASLRSSSRAADRPAADAAAASTSERSRTGSRPPLDSAASDAKASRLDAPASELPGSVSWDASSCFRSRAKRYMMADICRRIGSGCTANHPLKDVAVLATQASAAGRASARHHASACCRASNTCCSV